VEMTRKRTREKVETLFNDICICCNGTGTTPSIYWSMYEIESTFRRLEMQPAVTGVQLRMNPMRHQQFIDAGIDLKALADRYLLTLTMINSPEIPVDQHELMGIANGKQ